MSKKILIVEDETDLLEMISVHATHLGFTCMSDETGAGAISKAREFKPHVILLDMNLPAISGLGLLNEFRANHDLSNIPIVAFTAIGDPEVVEEAMERGASAYFTKGGSLEDLFTILHEFIDQGHSVMEDGPMHFEAPLRN